MPSRYVYQCQTNIVKGASDNTARDSNLTYMSVSDDSHGHICFCNVETRDITWWIILLILEMAWGSHFLLKMPAVAVSCLMSDISYPWDINYETRTWTIVIMGSWARSLSSWHCLTALWLDSDPYGLGLGWHLWPRTCDETLKCMHVDKAWLARAEDYETLRLAPGICAHSSPRRAPVLVGGWPCRLSNFPWRLLREVPHRT